MIIKIRNADKVEKKPLEWNVFWCIKPRIIRNNLVWLSRAERQLTGTRYDGASGNKHPVYAYRLMDWTCY